MLSATRGFWVRTESAERPLCQALRSIRSGDMDMVGEMRFSPESINFQFDGGYHDYSGATSASI
jgi:hypothetical protein